MDVQTEMEFAVEMTCNGCVDSVKKVLNTDLVDLVTVDLDKQRVVVKSKLAFQQVQDMLESTGKRAAFMGHGASMQGQHLGAAVAEISGRFVKGVVRMLQLDQNLCLIEGTVDGLSPGKHGLNIHEFGDLSDGCSSCGEHYNPYNYKHGGKNDAKRHVGDLGNIEARSNGRASFRFLDDQVKVWEIIGRSLVVHEGEDDEGKGGRETSRINGASGPGIACAIVARSAGLFQNNKQTCACDGVSVWDERNVPSAGAERSKHKQKL
ncbi:copper chaperone for superoxide dismutase-like [Ciona intestinalis]